MNMKPEKWVVCLFCVMFIGVVLANFSLCVADSPNPARFRYDVEIQGAKIISEGGYLWFHVVNHEPDWVSVAIRYPSDAITVKIFPSNVTLEANKTADFYFQVPYYWSQPTNGHQQNSSQTLKFNFAICGPTRAPTIGTQNIEFNVKVVPLNGGADDRYLLYIVILIMVAFVITAIAVIVKLDRQKRSRHARP
jgi:hypothetical protein